jgi:hypothetical protein
MTQSFRRDVDPVAALARKIEAMEQAIRDLQQRPFRIPVLATDPDSTELTNIWMLHDGRLRTRKRNSADTAWVIDEWVRTAPGSSSSSTSPPAPAAAPTSRVLTSLALWSQSYSGAGAARTDDGTVKLYYGNGGDGLGRNRALIGFDYAAIATALSGSTIKSVRLDLQNLATYYPGGATAYFGIHNYTSEPATWAGGGIPQSMAASAQLYPAQESTIFLPLDFATSIRDGTGKGVAMEAPSDSLEFYGVAAGFGSGYALPTLTVEYAK